MEKPVSGQGQEQELFPSGLNRAAPTSWSRDGKLLLYVVVDPKTNSDLWVLSRDGMTRTPFLHSNAAESQAQFSPDTRSACDGSCTRPTNPAAMKFSSARSRIPATR